MKALDAGPMLASATRPIAPDETKACKDAGINYVELEIGRARFFRLSLRVEPVANVVVLFAADLLEGIEADVMVGDR